MKLLFVRHAEPDYAHDTITAKGRIEAELLSHRLCGLDVKAFYCSPLGRARDTAAYTLDKLNRTAEILPWLTEFRGRVIDPQTGKERICWDFQPRFWTECKELYDPVHWIGNPLMAAGNVSQIYQESRDGLDKLLNRHGYHRNGAIYQCIDNRTDTLVFFCHFAITMAMVSHLCSLPPLPLWQGFCAQPSSVTTLISEERKKGEVYFRCMQLGDTSHLYAGGEAWSTAGLYPECYTGIDSTDPNDLKK